MSDSEQSNGFLGVVLWFLVVVTVAAGVACYFQLEEVKRIIPILFGLQAKLPGVTALFVNHGWWLLTIIPTALVLLLLYIVWTASSAMFRVSVAAIICVVVCALAGLAYTATKYPLEEIQKQLR
ncbi:MAG: hypothetical protein AAB263_06165 [Planctomycetota bacterium]